MLRIAPYISKRIYFWHSRHMSHEENPRHTHRKLAEVVGHHVCTINSPSEAAARQLNSTESLILTAAEAAISQQHHSRSSSGSNNKLALSTRRFEKVFWATTGGMMRRHRKKLILIIEKVLEFYLNKFLM